jgi:hypothetical protein
MSVFLNPFVPCFRANNRGAPPGRKRRIDAGPDSGRAKTGSMRRHYCRRSVLGPDEEVSPFHLCREPEALDGKDRAGSEFGGAPRVSPFRGFHRRGLCSARSDHNRIEQLAGRCSTVPAGNSRANHHRYVAGGDSRARASRGRKNQWPGWIRQAIPGFEIFEKYMLTSRGELGRRDVCMWLRRKRLNSGTLR